MYALSRQVISLLKLRKRSIHFLDALFHMHNIEGILTTCSYCKMVREDSGEWQHLEKYLSKTTDIRFSHGICNSCMEEDFPDVLEAWKDDQLNFNTKTIFLNANKLNSFLELKIICMSRLLFRFLKGI